MPKRERLRVFAYSRGVVSPYEGSECVFACPGSIPWSVFSFEVTSISIPISCAKVTHPMIQTESIYSLFLALLFMDRNTWFAWIECMVFGTKRSAFVCLMCVCVCGRDVYMSITSGWEREAHGRHGCTGSLHAGLDLCVAGKLAGESERFRRTLLCALRHTTYTV